MLDETLHVLYRSSAGRQRFLAEVAVPPHAMRRATGAALPVDGFEAKESIYDTAMNSSLRSSAADTWPRTKLLKLIDAKLTAADVSLNTLKRLQSRRVDADLSDQLASETQHLPADGKHSAPGLLDSDLPKADAGPVEGEQHKLEPARRDGDCTRHSCGHPVVGRVESRMPQSNERQRCHREEQDLSSTARPRAPSQKYYDFLRAGVSNSHGRAPGAGPSRSDVCADESESVVPLDAVVEAAKWEWQVAVMECLLGEVSRMPPHTSASGPSDTGGLTTTEGVTEPELSLFQCRVAARAKMSCDVDAEQLFRSFLAMVDEDDAAPPAAAAMSSSSGRLSVRELWSGQHDSLLDRTALLSSSSNNIGPRCHKLSVTQLRDNLVQKAESRTQRYNRIYHGRDVDTLYSSRRVEHSDHGDALRGSLLKRRGSH